MALNEKCRLHERSPGSEAENNSWRVLIADRGYAEKSMNIPVKKKYLIFKNFLCDGKMASPTGFEPVLPP
jgi:hypothetical protein